MDGALVTDVSPDSPADRAGVSVGDIVLTINRRDMHSAEDASRELERNESDRPVFVLVWRRGSEVFLQMRKN